MRYLAILTVVVTLPGCLAFTAGYAGGQAATADEGVQAYLASHDVDEPVAKAMLNGEFVEGMTKQEVKVLLEAEKPAGYEQTQNEELANGERWVFDSDSPKWPGQYVFRFEGGKLVEYSTP